MYANAGSAFTLESGIDEPFGQQLLSADLQELPVLIAQRLGFELTEFAGGKTRLAQSMPARAHIVLEYFVEAANVARQLSLNGAQADQLMCLMDTVLCHAGPASADRSVDAAVAAWDAALASVSADKDALGVVAGESGNTKMFTAAIRGKLDAWAKETGPLQARHYAMLTAAVSGPDTRARAAVTVRVPVEAPLSMPQLATAEPAQ